MARKLGVLTILAAFIILMAGCNIKQKIGESITEGILEKAMGDDADIDLDDGEFTIKGDDGEEITFNDENGMTIEGDDGTVIASGGDYEWPEGQAADLLPKFNKGKITYILNSPETCLVYVEGIDEEDYEAYVEEIVDSGYTENKFEMSTDVAVMYSGANSDNIVASASFYKEDGYVQISVDASNKNE